MFSIFLFFRLLNFGVLVALLTWAIKRYLIPFFANQIAAYIEHLKGLEKRRRHLANQADDEKGRLRDLLSRVKKITKNVDLWGMIQEEKEHRRAKDEANFAKQALQVEHVKAGQRAKARAYHKVHSDVVQSTRDYISKSFEGSDQAEKYSDALFKTLREL